MTEGETGVEYPSERVCQGCVEPPVYEVWNPIGASSSEELSPF